MITMQKRILVGLGIVLLIIIVRECEFIELHWSYANYTDHVEAFLSAEYSEEKGGKTYGKFTKKTGSYGTNAKDSKWELGFNTSPGKRIFSTLKSRLKEDLNSDKEVRANLDELEFSGLYWLPIIKTGSCTYSINADVTGKDGIVYKGTLTGKTEVKMVGISSASTMQRLLSKKVSSLVIANSKKAVE